MFPGTLRLRKLGKPTDLSKSQKDASRVLADLALVNLLINGASGKEPGQIRGPSAQISADMLTHHHPHGGFP